MDELIFFSIPGLVVTLSIIGMYPDIITSDSDQRVVVLALLTPLLGYIVHQFYRLFFEKSEGFGRKSRSVIRYIVEKLAPQESLSVSFLEAFLVWEVTIYDTEGFSDFLAHDAKSWHFILAFWGTSFASVLGITVSLIGYCVYRNEILIYIIFTQALLALLFWQKGNSIYKTINEQEVAFLRKNESKFLDCMKKIIN